MIGRSRRRVMSVIHAALPLLLAAFLSPTPSAAIPSAASSPGSLWTGIRPSRTPLRSRRLRPPSRPRPGAFRPWRGPARRRTAWRPLPGVASSPRKRAGRSVATPTVPTHGDHRREHAEQKRVCTRASNVRETRRAATSRDFASRPRATTVTDFRHRGGPHGRGPDRGRTRRIRHQDHTQARLGDRLALLQRQVHGAVHGAASRFRLPVRLPAAGAAPGRGGGDRHHRRADGRRAGPDVLHRGHPPRRHAARREHRGHRCRPRPACRSSCWSRSCWGRSPPSPSRPWRRSPCWAEG